jgi:hypothetical protein
VINLIYKDDVFNKNRGNGMFMGKPRPIILKNEQNNLYSEILKDCMDYFRYNNITWWKGKLTNHLLHHRSLA